MGLLTKILRRFLLYLFSVLTCSPDVLPKQKEELQEEAVNSNRNKPPSRWRRLLAHNFDVDPAAPESVVQILYLSVLFDLVDLANVAIDVIFAIKLFRHDDIALYYGIALLVGIVMGRLVNARGTMLLFQGGVRWRPFFIGEQQPAEDDNARNDDSLRRRQSLKNERFLAALYCLTFTEMAIFLFEDFPALVTYAHWMVVASFPPPKLEVYDEINVALSAAALVVLLAIALGAIVLALVIVLRREWPQWSCTVRLWNGFKMTLFFAICAVLVGLVLETLPAAVDIVFANKQKTLPNTAILGIPVCDNDETVDPASRESCDERLYILRVAMAWLVATALAAILTCCPAPPLLAQEESPAQARVSTLAMQAHPLSTLAVHAVDDDEYYDDDKAPRFDDEIPSHDRRRPPARYTKSYREGEETEL